MAESARTVVLVGRTGNGKSATGNSIIGADVFDSFPIPSSAGITATCQLHKTVLDNDQILNVIDTPGLFDTSVEPGIIQKEIAKCINMAKNGIHAFLVVLSVTTRFSQEEALTIEMLKQFFGGKIFDYMILVFTHGDALGEMSLADYLGRYCPEPLMKVLEMCGNTYVLFDNMTKDELKKSQQQMELLRLVDAVVVNNGGVAYSNELFVDSADICENGVKFNKAYEKLLLEKLQRVYLEVEQVARMQAEAAQMKSNEEISKVREDLKKAQRESEEKFKTYEDELLEMESKHREMILRLEKQLKDEQVAQMQAEADQIKSNDEIRKAREGLKRAQIEARKRRKTHKVTKESLKKMIQEKKDDENQKKTNNCAIFLIASSIEHQIESKLRETILKLENQLADKFARMQTEEALRKSNDEMRKLREDMERGQRYIKDAFEKIQLRMGEENQEKNNCSIYEITSAIDHQIDSKYRESIAWLDTVWAERAGRMQAEARTQEVEKKSKDKISKVREDLERTRRDGDNRFIESEIARLRRQFREVTNSSQSTML